MVNGAAQERAEFGDKFLKGMVEHGFVKLVNHTVPLPIVQDTFSQVGLVYHGSKAYDGVTDVRSDQKILQFAFGCEDTDHQ